MIPPFWPDAHDEAMGKLQLILSFLVVVACLCLIWWTFISWFLRATRPWLNRKIAWMVTRKNPELYEKVLQILDEED